MLIEHDSHNPLYRKPFGAVPCLSTVVLRLFVNAGTIPAAVRLKYSFKGIAKEADMPFVNTLLGGSIYETSVDAPSETGLIFYFFEVETETERLFYGNNEELTGGIGKASATPPKPFQITVFSPDFRTPEWFKKSIMYQIFPDRFFSGSMDSFCTGRTDIIRRDWKEQPYYKDSQFGGRYLSNDFFGGNLQGIIEKLAYLAELGIGLIYLNPVFEAFSNHKYDIGDYEKIDPMFGDNSLFTALCRKAQEYGIAVILDGVFNHTGSDSKYFNKENRYPGLGAYQSTASPYYKWYRFKNHPDDYECWWNVRTLPLVNESEPSYSDYILDPDNGIAVKWLKFGALGWRIDVADELPDSFIKQLRKNVKSITSEAVLIGEVWEDASNKISYGEQKEYLLGEEFDSVMNYPLRNAIIDFTSGKIDSTAFGKRLMSLKENYPREAFYSMMNLLSSHDIPRALTVLGDAPLDTPRDSKARFVLEGESLLLARQRLKLAVLLQMTLPGVPCIYYGDEAGMQGYEDPFNRGAFTWDNIDSELLDWYKKVISLRKEKEQLVSGELEGIYSYKQAYSFARVLGDKLLVISMNTGTLEKEYFRLDLERFRPTGFRAWNGEIWQGDSPLAQKGIVIFELQPLGWSVLEIDLAAQK